tara:strand:+ start:968 stop:1786 length:819 start_codon:yes stop_codon:yes gene_type:complete
MSYLYKEKILVCYLITKFDDKNNLSTFLKNYNKFDSGHSHELLICFKLLSNEQIKIFKEILKEVNYIEFVDEYKKNDFDLGSYKRVSIAYSSRYIFFLNGYSYPICDNWLGKIIKNYKIKSILATSGSYESLLTSIKPKKIYKIISYLFRLIKYKNLFNPFPNPHIRTTGFLIKGVDYINFMQDKIIETKEDVWKIESGKYSLTNYFKNLDYNIYIINSDGQKFLEKDWKISKTYNYSDQNKSIISDRHIRKYHNSNSDEKLKFQKNTWGSI